ncbi:MAG TPA: YeeE/YedE thiosulfate transporter family protein [Oligoflexus sp.]|uniref:YeeE/YedE family protein n=1 Tax=Oligoflexus sp. TaxID=1971216 RepID=UPI002D7E58EB|nr:YeeE/YedE thiosulfate transporter family protein [Oligoflexus sp.]HET9237727.1 YeeE/YedE thiosulfate transporter family protein [Oligoflexus sp.]
MIPQDWIHALLGGIIIGTAVSMMLLMNGRVTGISGIINGAISPQKGDTAWRWLFVAGLIVGGLTLGSLNPQVFGQASGQSPMLTIAAGLLVGVGTIMGSGCTSGHGVCGISRFSPRSLVATITFIGAGMVSVFILRTLGVIP